MVDASQRSAYLRALGIEQWQPRAQPLLEAVDEPVSSPLDTDKPGNGEAASSAIPRESSGIEGVEAYKPYREHLQDDRAFALLEQASVNWLVYKEPKANLAVLAVDATGSLLGAADLDQDQDTLQKMLGAIGCDLNQSAQGGLHWQSEASGLRAPNVLLLVDSGEDQAVLIQHWRDKTLKIQGATVVIAPHPCMFAQGTALKRFAWNSLQLLQKNWAA